MIYTIDRVQYSRLQNKYYVFEFLEIQEINNLLNHNGRTVKFQDSMWFRGFWIELYKMVKEPVKEKLEFLQNWDTNATRIFVLYQKGINTFIKIEIEPGRYNCDVGTFNDLQQWFRALNNIDGDSYSKGLGVSRDLNVDKYVNGLLCQLYNDAQFADDNGLELTKALLNGDSTKAIDFDLFQYIPSTKEVIIYEFLKRESPYIDNISAHPMRYSWTGKIKDNKQKYISFWKAKQYLNARLFLISYSDNYNEKVSIMEVMSLDENSGFVEENKYVMSQNVFLGWLKDMNNYQKGHNDYFSDFKYIKYDNAFFEKYHSNKFDYNKQYGKEFRR
ncbi:hypothetical protein M3182_04480 [Mesobacillus maritimus]|uniref:hypothetical protein n=1 Tax=Mesobacillus maritimus TaxID=1643336 RepID=UPI00203EB1FA|nr:hypothetical protein [Mesobacillus maritimus]MCM3585002.1 hypothetical protein [Mesobacillus maritimus]